MFKTYAFRYPAVLRVLFALNYNSLVERITISTTYSIQSEHVIV